MPKRILAGIEGGKIAELREMGRCWIKQSFGGVGTVFQEPSGGSHQKVIKMGSDNDRVCVWKVGGNILWRKHVGEPWGAEWKQEQVRGHGGGLARNVSSVDEEGGQGAEGHSTAPSICWWVLTQPFLHRAWDPT